MNEIKVPAEYLMIGDLLGSGTISDGQALGDWEGWEVGKTCSEQSGVTVEVWWEAQVVVLHFALGWKVSVQDPGHVACEWADYRCEECAADFAGEREYDRKAGK